jgi:hypothetical protein
MTKIKIALAAALIAAAGSAAFAASAQRYQQTPAFQQSDVALRAGNVDANNWFAVEQSDRASSPYAGGN